MFGNGSIRLRGILAGCTGAKVASGAGVNLATGCTTGGGGPVTLAGASVATALAGGSAVSLVVGSTSGSGRGADCCITGAGLAISALGPATVAGVCIGTATGCAEMLGAFATGGADGADDGGGAGGGLTTGAKGPTGAWAAIGIGAVDGGGAGGGFVSGCCSGIGFGVDEDGIAGAGLTISGGESEGGGAGAGCSAGGGGGVTSSSNTTIPVVT